MKGVLEELVRYRIICFLQIEFEHASGTMYLPSITSDKFLAQEDVVGYVSAGYKGSLIARNNVWEALSQFTTQAL